MQHKHRSLFREDSSSDGFSCACMRFSWWMFVVTTRLIVQRIRYSFLCVFRQTTSSVVHRDWKRSRQLRLGSFIRVYSDWKWFLIFFYVSWRCHMRCTVSKEHLQINKQGDSFCMTSSVRRDIEWPGHWCVKHQGCVVGRFQSIRSQNDAAIGFNSRTNNPGTRLLKKHHKYFHSQASSNHRISFIVDSLKADTFLRPRKSIETLSFISSRKRQSSVLDLREQHENWRRRKQDKIFCVFSRICLLLLCTAVPPKNIKQSDRQLHQKAPGLRLSVVSLSES